MAVRAIHSSPGLPRSKIIISCMLHHCVGRFCPHSQFRKPEYRSSIVSTLYGWSRYFRKQECNGVSWVRHDATLCRYCISTSWIQVQWRAQWSWCHRVAWLLRSKRGNQALCDQLLLTMFKSFWCMTRYVSAHRERRIRWSSDVIIRWKNYLVH